LPKYKKKVGGEWDMAEIMNARNDRKDVTRQTGEIPPIRSGQQPANPLRVLVKRRWQLFACLLLICGIAFAAVSLRQPKYRAATRVQLTKDKPQIGGMTSIIGGGDRDYISTQCILLQSRPVLAQAAKNLNMSGGHWIYSDEGIKQLRDAVKVQPVAGSRLIDIIATAETGSKAASIANQVAAAYIDISVRARQATNKQLITGVNELIEQCEEEIEQIEENVRRFQQENLITGANSALAAVEGRISRIENELTHIQMQRLQLEAQRDKYKNMLSSGRGVADPDSAVPEISNDPIIRSYQQELTSLEKEEAQMSRAYLPGHHKLRNVRLRIAELQTKLLEKKQKLLQDLFEDTTKAYAATVTQEESLQQMLSHQKEIGVKLTGQNQQYQKMLVKLENVQKFKTDCLAKLRQFDLEEGMNPSPVIVVDAARPPRKPTGLSKPHQAASILLLGLVFSIGFVFAVERFSAEPSDSRGGLPPATYLPPSGAMPWVIWQGQTDPRTPTAPVGPGEPDFPDDTETMKHRGVYSCSTLAQIKTIELGGKSDSEFAFAGRCRIINIDPSCAAAETFRELSSNLLTRFGQTKQSLVVTSVLPRSGKTTCASNLAQLLARAGRKVALVEANTSRPALHRAFNVKLSENQPDVQDVLTDITQLDQALYDTETANLTVLVNRNSEPIVDDYSSAQVEWLYNELRERFDWVIYDAGAVQQVFTKSLLAVTGKGLCVTNGSEHPDEIHGAEAQVELCGAVCIGAIENTHPENREKTENKRETMKK
jgi:uncharacterized protein involved in exopolysaccharide biosynthesis/Mrp family chromosome partitioning ATPase